MDDERHGSARSPRSTPRRRGPLVAAPAGPPPTPPQRARPLVAPASAVPATDEAADEPGRGARLRWLAELPILAVVALVVTLLVKALLAQAFYIPSASMEPQLREGDRVVVSRTAYRLHDPNRGDVVVFPSPAVPAPDEAFLEGIYHDVLEALSLRDPGERELIKRIVGLPGETIEGRDGRVLIDGRTLREPYLDGVETSDFGPLVVPEGHVFVLGDNRDNSHDSRFPDIGPIEIDTIVGRAVARVWPPSRTAFL